MIFISHYEFSLRTLSVVVTTSSSSNSFSIFFVCGFLAMVFLALFLLAFLLVDKLLLHLLVYFEILEVLQKLVVALFAPSFVLATLTLLSLD